ncbi:MAG: hypothetical protein AB1918_02840 [Pseudomonadota bacterium]
MRRSSFLDTPPKLTGEIRRFCAAVAAAEPLFIKLVPFPGCEADSVANLPGQCARFGGTAVDGWRVVVWPRVLIQAERHLIWHSPKDELIDVTPAGGGASTLFLPDPEAGAKPGPIRHPLVRDANLARWIALAAEGREMAPEALRAFADVVRAHAKPTDPCHCGSGRQMRRCHPVK